MTVDPVYHELQNIAPIHLSFPATRRTNVLLFDNYRRECWDTITISEDAHVQVSAISYRCCQKRGDNFNTPSALVVVSTSFEKQHLLFN